jgi:hypothetical protein
MLQIPSKFVEWFRSIPGKIPVLTNTGCNSKMTTKIHTKTAIIDQGWVAFVVTHKLNVGHFLTFHKDAPGLYIVVIFDYTCTQVMTRCPDHEIPLGWSS